MKLVKWRRPGMSYWQSVFDDTDLFEWSDLPSDSGLNVYETDNEVVVEASVPGIPEDEVRVTVEGNVLTIEANHEEAEEEKDKKKTIYKESRKTSFRYSTSLPRMVDSEKASAEVENGVLKVIVPKLEEEKPKKIDVKKKQ